MTEKFKVVPEWADFDEETGGMALRQTVVDWLNENCVHGWGIAEGQEEFAFATANGETRFCVAPIMWVVINNGDEAMLFRLTWA